MISAPSLAERAEARRNLELATINVIEAEIRVVLAEERARSAARFGPLGAVDGGRAAELLSDAVQRVRERRQHEG
jgi:hypothetical protein